MRLKPTEAETQKAIMDFLAFHGIFALRLNTSSQVLEDYKGRRRFLRSHSGGKGTADILALVPGDFPGDDHRFSILWIECKSDDGKQTPEQKSFEADVRSRWHQYIVARSVDDVMRTLEAIYEDLSTATA